MPSYLHVELYTVFSHHPIDVCAGVLDNQGVLLVISCVLLFYYVPRLPRQHSGDKSIMMCFTKSSNYELLVLH